ncbi:MAG: DNA polymerase III subunit delta [Anaerolineales bacterium]
MSNPSPSVYLLHGDDEFAIRSFLDERLKTRMGESSDTTMDITTLDGRSKSLEAIQAETHTVPFLAKRRMVVLHHPLALAKGKTKQGKFKELLESVPSSTALVLIEDSVLDDKHWLINWSREHTDQAWSQLFTLPRGGAMTRWIMDQAQGLGGEFDNQAAQLLASYIDEDPRLAKSEIEKLLTYVDFSRAVSEEDVHLLVADVHQGDVFEMVDAIGYGDGEKAIDMLRRLLEESDSLLLFGMIIRQFRLLIQVRELLDENPGRSPEDIAAEMGAHPYPIKKITPQAKLFNLPQLKRIYHQLSEMDHAIKTGRLNDKLALDLLIASLTQ